MRTITFRPDRSVHEKKGEVVQNLMVAVDDEQSHFLDHKKLWYLIKPRFFGILGKKKETSITVHADETNTLDPFSAASVIVLLPFTLPLTISSDDLTVPSI